MTELKLHPMFNVLHPDEIDYLIHNSSLTAIMDVVTRLQLEYRIYVKQTLSFDNPLSDNEKFYYYLRNNLKFKDGQAILGVSVVTYYNFEKYFKYGGVISAKLINKLYIIRNIVKEIFIKYDAEN